MASTPAKPTDVPVSDASVTSDSEIKVAYASPAPANGGSAITSYELQMDDGEGGDFVSIHGFSPSSMITHYTAKEDVTKGRMVRFRYRAQNAVGWGPFSDEASILAATVPSAPEAPTFSSFSSGTLYLKIGQSEDNGGTAILDMELWRDQGDDYSSVFQEVSLYDGQALLHALTAVEEGLESGKIYRFKQRSRNGVGYSAWSLESYVAFGDVAGAPGQPSRVSSSRTSITVRWTAPTVAAEDLPLLGYVLNMDNGVDLDLEPVYIGMHRPELLEYTVGGLTTGLPYLFSVQAINQNGYSSHSTFSTFYPCVAPPSIDMPSYVSSSQTSKTITIEW